MTEVIDQLVSGSLGFFWFVEPGRSPDLDDDKAMRGFLRRREDEIELVLLRDDPFAETEARRPIGFIGATEHSGVVVRDLIRSSRTLNYGGSKASVDRYAAQTVIAEPTIDSVSSLDLVSMSVLFHGDRAMEWSGLKAVEQKITTNKQNRVQQVRLDMRSVPDAVAPLSPSSSLRLSAHWRSSPDPHRGYTIDTGLRVSVETSRPTPRWSPTLALARVQDLLGIAFGGYYAVVEGYARPAGSSDDGRIWNSHLMWPPPPAAQADRRSFPMFTIEEIGGIDGVVRWIRLCKSHPRAVSPIINRLRQDRRSPEVQTLELAAAIEYWVAYNRGQGRAWAKKNKEDTPVAALARYVGPAFADWITDPAKWAACFWGHYNGLKHDPRFQYSRHDLSLLSEVAHQLMVAALLNRVACTKQPARSIFDDYRNARLGQDLRNLVSGNTHSDREGNTRESSSATRAKTRNDLSYPSPSDSEHAASTCG